MEINEMKMPDIEARMAEIKALLETDDADIDALSAEFDKLQERANELKNKAEKRNALAGKVAAGVIGNVIEEKSMEENQMNTKTYTANSPEYRTAWLKDIAVRNGEKLFGDFTQEEREAFTFLTSNTSAVVPTPIQDRIIELVESQYPLYRDAKKSGLSQGFSIPRHTAITQGDAAATNEAVANDDEADTFGLLTLEGVEIKKHIVISRKMKFKSIEAFENWVVEHIAARIGVAKEAQIITRLGNTATGIAAANVLTNQTYADATIRTIFSKIRGTGAKKVYANANTIWNGLVGIQEANGVKAFVPDSMSDPLAVGRIYGAVVVEDNNLSDNVAYFGIPSQILANDYDDLTINHAMDPKTFEDIVAGYSLFDAGLENPLSFAKVTFTTESL